MYDNFDEDTKIKWASLILKKFPKLDKMCVTPTLYDDLCKSNEFWKTTYSILTNQDEIINDNNNIKWKEVFERGDDAVIKNDDIQKILSAGISLYITELQDYIDMNVQKVDDQTLLYNTSKDDAIKNKIHLQIDSLLEEISEDTKILKKYKNQSLFTDFLEDLNIKLFSLGYFIQIFGNYYINPYYFNVRSTFYIYFDQVPLNPNKPFIQLNYLPLDNMCQVIINILSNQFSVSLSKDDNNIDFLTVTF